MTSSFTSNSAGLQQQIYQQEQRIREARAKELERQLAAQHPANEIEDAQNRIAVLNQQRLGAAWEEAKQQNAQLVHANDDAVNALLDALQLAAQTLLGAIGDQPRAVIETFNNQQKHASYAISEQVTHWQRQNPQIASIGGIERAVSLGNELPNALALKPAFALWVSRAKNPTEERLRQGIVYALSGYAFKVTHQDNADLAEFGYKDCPARAQNDGDIRARRSSGIL